MATTTQRSQDLCPNSSVFSSYLSIYKSKTFRRRPYVWRRAAFHPHKKLFDSSCRECFDNFEKRLLEKKKQSKKQGHFESNSYSEVPLVLLHQMDITQLFATGGLEMTTRRKTLKTFKKVSPVFTRCDVYKTWDWPFSNTSLRYKVLHSKSSVLMFLPSPSYHYFI